MDRHGRTDVGWCGPDIQRKLPVEVQRLLSLRRRLYPRLGRNGRFRWPDRSTEEPQAWVDVTDFNAGYLVRGAHLLPKRLGSEEWQHSQDYWGEVKKLPEVDLDGGVLHYS